MNEPSVIVTAQNYDRRNILRLFTLAGIGGALASCATTPDGAPSSSRREARPISFYHKGDRFSGVYKIGNKFQTEALKGLNHTLRDKRPTGGTREMDPRLYDILYQISQKLGVKSHFNVISGYRTVATNELLRKRGIRRRGRSGVARGSFHTMGMAIDFNIPGVSLHKIRNAAIEVAGGGVGYYSSHNFVHIDTGPLLGSNGQQRIW